MGSIYSLSFFLLFLKLQLDTKDNDRKRYIRYIFLISMRSMLRDSTPSLKIPHSTSTLALKYEYEQGIVNYYHSLYNFLGAQAD